MFSNTYTYFQSTPIVCYVYKHDSEPGLGDAGTRANRTAGPLEADQHTALASAGSPSGTGPWVVAPAHPLS